MEERRRRRRVAVWRLESGVSYQNFWLYARWSWWSWLSLMVNILYDVVCEWDPIAVFNSLSTWIIRCRIFFLSFFSFPFTFFLGFQKIFQLWYCVLVYNNYFPILLISLWYIPFRFLGQIS